MDQKKKKKKKEKKQSQPAYTTLFSCAAAIIKQLGSSTWKYNYDKLIFRETATSQDSPFFIPISVLSMA